jgi:hypothetical protein
MNLSNCILTCTHHKYPCSLDFLLYKKFLIGPKFFLGGFILFRFFVELFFSFCVCVNSMSNSTELLAIYLSNSVEKMV